MTTEQTVSILILMLVFAVGGLRRVHVGALALAAALAVGLTLSSESVVEILTGFPVDLMLLLLGMTFLLEVARGNGTVDLLVNAAVRRAGNRRFLVPWIMFAVSLVIASLGNPLASMVVIPVAMALAGRNGLDPVVTGLGAINGSLVGCFAPTSLYGILTVEVGEQGGVTVNPWAQFAFVLAVIAALQLAAQLIFRRHSPAAPGDDSQNLSGQDAGGSARHHEVIDAPRTRTSENSDLEPIPPSSGVTTSSSRQANPTVSQRVTVLVLVVLIALAVGLPIADVDTNVGAIALGLALVLCALFPKETKNSVAGIDWTTILLVGGIVTYVALLGRQGAIDALGELTTNIPWPMLAVFTLCVVGALISAFASTTALLPVIIPLSLPLVIDGEISGVGLIIALSFSATLVDSMPFSTSGAVMVASASEADRPRVMSLLTKWGLSMVVIGPVVSCALLVLPSAP